MTGDSNITGILSTRLDGMTREMDRRFDDIQQILKRIEDSQSEDFVRREEFAPVMWIAYGMVGFVTLGVLGAVLTLVIRSAPS